MTTRPQIQLLSFQSELMGLAELCSQINQQRVLPWAGSSVLSVTLNAPEMRAVLGVSITKPSPGPCSAWEAPALGSDGKSRLQEEQGLS